MKWNKEDGIWSLVDTKWITIHGTTFRNADHLTLSIDINPVDYGVEFFVGRHIGIHLWPPDGIKTWEWKPKKCKCYGCMIHRPMSRETAQAINKIINDPNYKSVKLPPRPEKRLYSETEDEE